MNFLTASRDGLGKPRGWKTRVRRGRERRRREYERKLLAKHDQLNRRLTSTRRLADRKCLDLEFLGLGPGSPLLRAVWCTPA